MDEFKPQLEAMKQEVSFLLFGLLVFDFEYILWALDPLKVFVGQEGVESMFFWSQNKLFKLGVFNIAYFL